MKCTAAFIGGTPQVFLVPPLATILVILWLLIWLIVAIHIASVGEMKPR
jgi:phosphotransferase system  glucose/maltose/N-acetylglucosamine-specific IIC component